MNLNRLVFLALQQLIGFQTFKDHSLHMFSALHYIILEMRNDS